MSVILTIRLEEDIKNRLDRLAAATQRSKSALAAEAIRSFVESNEWQVDAIRAALKEADVGNYASEQDVANLAMKWKAREN